MLLWAHWLKKLTGSFLVVACEKMGNMRQMSATVECVCVGRCSISDNAEWSGLVISQAKA